MIDFPIVIATIIRQYAEPDYIYAAPSPVPPVLRNKLKLLKPTKVKQMLWCCGAKKGVKKNWKVKNCSILYNLKKYI
jgi:hypothetical protein